MDFSEPTTSSTDSIPLNQYTYRTAVVRELPKSDKPILTDDYELRPCLIEMVKSQPFSSLENKNPYDHLSEFEQTCACLHIAGMSDETLRWKLFPFSLEGKAKAWYDQAAPKMNGDWEALCSSFCLQYFSVEKVVCLQIGRAHV